MKTEAAYRHWMAEEIAKLYLLGSEMIDLAEPANGSSKEFDFIAIPRKSTNKTLPIEVKSLKKSTLEISKTYKNIRENLLKKEHPILIFYIDAMERTGFVELINKALTDRLAPLTMDNVKHLLKEATKD